MVDVCGLLLYIIKSRVGLGAVDYSLVVQKTIFFGLLGLIFDIARLNGSGMNVVRLEHSVGFA